MTTSEQIISFVSELTGIHPVHIGHFSELTDSLGMDSMEIAELAVKIEAEFDIDIPSEDLAKMKTVGDVTEYVETAIVK